MELTQFENQLYKGEYFELLEYILDSYDFSRTNEIDNISDFLNPFIDFATNFLPEVKMNYSSIKENYQLKLAEELLNITVKSLVLEIQIKKLECITNESDPQKRLKIFLYELLKDKNSYIEFFKIYNQLLVILLKRIFYFAKNFREILDRFNNDLDLLKNSFDLKDTALLAINLSLGDSHNNGLVVSEIVFRDKSIIYKPRNNEISYAADNFLTWLSNNSSYSHYSPIMINRNGYSWEEKIEYTSCQNEKEVEKYYLNFGYISGFIYLLNGTDYHYENIIAQREHPVLIDNETLLHPELYKLLDSQSSHTYTILSTSLFPNPKVNLDLSALTGDCTQLDRPMETLVNVDNDEIGFTKSFIELPGQFNIPLIKGEKVEVNSMAKENIIKGFEAFFATIIQHKSYLLSENSPIKLFENLKIRVLLRYTMRYHETMMKSTHPDHIKTRELQKMFILKNLSSEYGKYVFNEKTIEYETNSIINFDIPYFYTYTCGKNIYFGDEISTGWVLDKSPYERLLDKITNLDIADSEEQVELIEKLKIW